MHCMSVSLGPGRRGAGHRVGSSAGHVDARRCRITDVVVNEIESDPFNYYYVARK